MEEWVKGMIQDLTAGEDIAQKITDLVTNGTSLITEETIGGLVDAVSVIGYAMCALFFMTALVDLATSERANFETFFKFFSKLIVGWLMIFYSKEMINLGLGMSTWVSEIVTKTLKLNEEARVYQINFAGRSIDTMGTFDLLGFGLQLFFPSLVIKLAQTAMIVAATILCFSRTLEMALRAVFMPIALGMMTDDGWKGAGGRYLKKYIALCVQGPALVILATLYTKLSANVMWPDAQPVYDSVKNMSVYIVSIAGSGEIWSAFVPSLGMGFALIGLSMKSINIINDVFGV